MTIKIVTSTNKDGLERTRNFVDSVDKYFKGRFEIEVCYHGLSKAPTFKTINHKVTTRNLDDDPDFVAFYNSKHPRNVPGSIWHHATAWSPKIYAMLKSARKGYSHLVWMDNDIDIYDRITPRDLHLKGDFTYCYREAVRQLEGCFMGFDVRSVATNVFMDTVLNVYNSGQIWAYDMLTDQFILSRVAEDIEALKKCNLTPSVTGLDAFNQSPMYPKMYHNKGAKKELLYRNRYEQLLHLVERYKPEVIVEVGTGPGMTGMAMLSAALKHRKKVKFYGFGLFEDETAEQQVEGYTTKKNLSKKEMELQIKKAFGDRVKAKLFKGDSRVTMPGNVPKRVDFAYIDGGHHLDIVKSDYENTKHADIIVFDDYWTDYKWEDDPPAENRMAPYFDSLGCEVLPSTDPCISILKKDSTEISHRTHLAVLLNRGVPLPKNWAVNNTPQGIRVNPVDCVPKDNLKSNIVNNLNMVRRWFSPFAIHGREAILVSAGLSLPKHLEEIRELQQKGGEIFCVKHALPTLRDAGIIPEYCIVLDPRELDEESTHGVKRRDLFEAAPQETIFLVASMTNPYVTKYLLDGGHKVIGWNARTSSVIELGIPGVHVMGGSCSAARGMVFATLFGFRKMHLFGYDFYVDDPGDKVNETVEEGRRKYLQYPTPSGKVIWTTGELIAAIQDMQSLFGQMRDVVFVVHGDNITKEIHDILVPEKMQEYHGKDAYWTNST